MAHQIHFGGCLPFEDRVNAPTNETQLFCALTGTIAIGLNNVIMQLDFLWIMQRDKWCTSHIVIDSCTICLLAHSEKHNYCCYTSFKRIATFQQCKQLLCLN